MKLPRNAMTSRVYLVAVFLSVVVGLSSPLRAAKKVPLAVPDGVLFENGIEYSNPDSQHLKLNMARPKTGRGPFPGIVCIHGGGFRAGSRESFNKLCLRLAEHGYVAVTVTYRLAPKYQFPAAVHDVKAAVRWMRANADKYNIDPKRIGTTGGSAGGHLAQFLAVTGGVKQFEGDGGNSHYSSSVACVVNFYGPSDLTKSYGASVDAAEVLPLFLGGNLKTARHRHIIASPLYWVTPSAAPTLCIHGTKDRYVAHEQAVWLIDRLKASDVEARLMTIKGADHGFRGASKTVRENIENARIAFFDKHLKPKPRSAPAKRIGRKAQPGTTRTLTQNKSVKSGQRSTVVPAVRRIANRRKVPGKLKLGARIWIKDPKGSGKKLHAERHLVWNVSETAIIICDMWDGHYCKSAARRVADMAPRMNRVITAARNRGVMIIHAPSGTMKFYANTPQRLRMMQATHFKPPVPLKSWCYRRDSREPKLPVDVRTSPCDDSLVGAAVRRFSRQHDIIKIAGYDGISDSGTEIYNFLRQEGIKNVVLMGVHTNMCVLGRPFGIRQLVDVGMNVVLARDLTDAMYDPRQFPYVSHTRGTELVIEHIEKYWCPSILSEDLTKVVLGSDNPKPKRKAKLAGSNPTLLTPKAK